MPDRVLIDANARIGAVRREAVGETRLASILALPSDAQASPAAPAAGCPLGSC
ncbi:hypothetical protein [Kallotenue papyrolyticum]|uniref:hypothetical protein n=1 Tax=Kallotenue papyrolyticum TaxID=1325125 RepID=UPI0013780C69|nr:hypothetical protein [Kallotenue papyrolyticum]